MKKFPEQTPQDSIVHKPRGAGLQSGRSFVIDML
jgi:hypothetical protein